MPFNDFFKVLVLLILAMENLMSIILLTRKLEGFSVTHKNQIEHCQFLLQNLYK